MPSSKPAAPPLANADLLAREVARFDPSLPIERATMPPATWYTEPAFGELDRRALLHREWVPVALASKVAKRSQWLSGCTAGLPWVITRDEAGALRAFHNVCLHKANLVATPAGDGDRLTCGYHGWQYDLTGRLRSAPKIAGVEDFDRDDMSLAPLAVCQIGPWVFINADLSAPALPAQLSELVARLERTDWTRLRYAESAEWIIECNWKVFVDNYLDGGYHVPHLHPSLDDQIDMAQYKTELFDRFSIQSTTANADSPAGARAEGGAVYAWLYPYFMINRYGDCMDTNLVVPMGPSRCQVLYDFFFFEPDSPQAVASIEQSALTQREDVDISEQVQVGLSSGAYRAGRYAPRVEQAEYHFHQLLHASYTRELSG